MNKTAIKNFAVRARNRLIEDITQKAYELGITKNEIRDIETFEGGFKIRGLDNSKTYKKYEIKQREKLISNIKEKGLEQVIEEVAYTWFNRFIALRFMEVNEYLPTGVRVLSSIEKGKTEPDIIKEVSNIDLGIDKELVYKLIDTNDTEDLYKYLIVKQCNQLGEIMPMVFEEISDYTELLLPDNLLAEGSVVRDLVDSIEEYDYKDQVEIIGWMYQYYISEKKDEVFADLKKNKKITKENIPAATQLFTPKWIVKYMVENSLGRLWLESHPDEELKAQWKYYLEEAEQDPEVQEKLDELKNPNLNPEDIKVLDPSMGSGHILVYAFDVLYDIYLKANYSERDIPQLILEKNLYGLDIDDRAGQLAAFALMMKARSKNRRIFRKRVELNVCSIQESNGIPKEAVEFLVSSKETEIERRLHREEVECLINVFHNAKEYGSILEIKEIDFDALRSRIEEIKDYSPADIFEYQYKELIVEKVLPLINQALIMSQKYDVVCTNPPYMGRRGMNSQLIKLLDGKFKDSKSDLFAVFMDLASYYLKHNGFIAIINQHSWMFLSGYEKLREKIIKHHLIYNMLHLGPHAFEEIGGEVVQSTTFVLRKLFISDYKGNYIRLTDSKNAKEKEEKTLEAISNQSVKNRYVVKTIEFSEIPGSPIAYWATEKYLKLFRKNEPVSSISKGKSGQNTGDNNRFLRRWSEVSKELIGFSVSSDYTGYGFKWILYNKGGEYRRWYGNYDYVVNWENDGKEIKDYAVLRNNGKHWSRYIQNLDCLYKQGVTWSIVTSSTFSMRYLPKGFICDYAGCAIFPPNDKLNYLLGLFNTKVANVILNMVNPTINYQPGNIGSVPYVYSQEQAHYINQLVESSVSISKFDWNSFETSWDFKKHPLLYFKENTDIVEKAFKNWSNFAEQQFNKLKRNEEELNRIFIEIYGLRDELTHEVEDKDITISKADRERDIKSFITYAVGCMFGRYSLDEEGLIYAGGEFDINKYKTFGPTKDNILVIADDDYFEDDIVNRFVQFVKITFGEKTLEENLDYIAETLGQKSNETSRQAIRRYFLKDFYNEHVKTYSKRPIYWLFDSGKENGFRALIYLHRYDVSTVARVRTDYLHKLQKKYESEVRRIDILLESDLSVRDKAAAMKKKDNINKQILECLTYDQVIAHVANQKIDIDLDDGVAVNYDKFQGVKIPQGEGKKPLTANLLAKI